MIPAHFSPTLVRVNPSARRAFPFLPPATVPGAWWIGPLGERVHVLADGYVESIPEPFPHYRGPAADPNGIEGEP